MTLNRNYSGVKADKWISPKEFVGYVEWNPPGRLGDIFACYGWSKNGESFFIYRILHGHIEKLGRVKKAEIRSHY